MADEAKRLNLSAYYYSFDPTGCQSIDEILEAVARAGGAYHQTEDWNDETDGEAPVDWIQNAAVAAANSHDALKKIAGEMAKVLKEFSDFWAYGLQADKGPTRDDLRRAEELGAMVASVLDRYETATKGNLNEKTNQQTS